MSRQRIERRRATSTDTLAMRGACPNGRTRQGRQRYRLGRVRWRRDRRARATAELIRERYPNVDVAEWLDQNPYQDRDMVARWKDDLVAAGAIVPGRGDLQA